MTSRLDRLVTLLETGSTQLIRNTAAQQLADVQKQHPDELFNLLTRVIPYLKSKSWDTRIAAAKAIGGIVDNAEKFDPNVGDAQNKSDGNGKIDGFSAIKKERDDVDDTSVSEDQLRLDHLDIGTILKYGKKLLGSAGKEYDYSLASLDPADRLAYQKKSLTARLGLGGEYMEDDLLNEKDFASNPHHGHPPVPGMPRLDTSYSHLSRQSSISSPTAYSAMSPHDPMQTPTDESGLSKRQLNQLKRKNKLNAKTHASKVRVVDLSVRRTSMDVPQTPSCPEPHQIKTEIKTEDSTGSTSDYFSLDRSNGDDDTKVVSEFKGPIIPEKSVIQTEAEEEGCEWPYERLCEFLTVDLFDHSWEIRHGAAMGIREVIRVHGAGAGRERGKSRTENDRLNRRWLDDLACRLCCVFMLDRFGDYISDNVVAPIRETIGQSLGALLVHLPASLVHSVFRILQRMVMQTDLELSFPIWEVCHGGMIGLRYLVAVRNDLLLKDNNLIDGVIQAVMKGLGDFDDDVRAVSAATLVPIAKEFVDLRPGSLHGLINIVWDCLSNLRDDLSASTGSVMDLLAKLCSFPQVLEAMKKNASNDPEQSFALLVPRLYPFLRHTITSVRSAVLRALLTFLDIEGEGTKGWVNGKILRLIFQNLLVERNEGVLKMSLQVWMALLTVLTDMGLDHFAGELMTHLDPLISLSLSPIGVSRYPIPMDPSLFIRPSGQTYSLPGAATRKQSPLSAIEPPTKRRKKSEKKEEPPPSAHNVDGHMIQGDVDLVGIEVLVRSKIYAARALGTAMSLWPKGASLNVFGPRILPYLQSSYSSTQLTAATIVEEYARFAAGENTALALTFATALHPLVEQDRPSCYADLVSYLQVVRAQCHSLLNTFRDVGRVQQSKIPTIAVVVQGDADAGPDAFSIVSAEKIVEQDFERLKKGLTPAQRVTSLQSLNDSKTNAINAIEEAKLIKEQRDIRIRAAAASAMVALKDIPKKPSHIIKGMMDSVKKEENAELQRRSAAAIASLIEHYAISEKRGPVDKVILNLAKFCCVDTSETPEFHHNAHFEEAILSLRKEEDRKDHPDAAKFEREAKEARIMRRGAKEALEQLAYIFGSELLEKVPTLKSLMKTPLKQAFNEDLPNDIKDPNDNLGQEVVDGLSTIRALLPKLHPGIHPFIIHLMPLVVKALNSSLSVFRYAAAKCFATICSVITVQGMTMLVEKVIPSVSNALDVRCRQGAIESIYHLIHVMEDDILPYVIFLIVPVLGRMSDSDNDVRLIATTTFATLVKLVPLEAGIPDPPGLSEELLKGRDRERKFIAQMLDVHKVEAFEIPVAIKAELRSYQQEGVNWLAFLNRYHLHGILCDDMGLGKTLQTLCIVASDHHIRAEEYTKTKAPEVRRLPSLIVCPPTLSGHWQQEIKTYAPFLTSVAYVGPPADRARVRSLLGTTDIVITSYDICRNDVDVLAPLSWNYCVLDEGHLIKNPKAKTSMAVKRLLSNHRLILSGTPIQNNVLELWSLFDFLMPGFLGTEKVFLDRFAKPIAASRFSKSSSKEQEAGALAIEALHKQVLPFLLRRLKEEVLNDLPPKIIQNYYCDLSDLQRRLFEDFQRKEGKTLADKASSGDKEAKQHIFQALQYMRKLCNSPALVMKEGHKQYEQTQKELARKHSSLRDPIHAPKLTALHDLLVDCGIGTQTSTEGDLPTETSYVSQHRALIFCQMKEMLDMVQNDVLKKMLPSVQYLRLDGSVEATKRQSIVNQFNTDPSYDVLLLTTSVGGLGLNLTGADTVIFVEHDWNPQKDIQAMDRAHRIGQKKVVNVYRLITRGTLEEKIMSLQRFKIDVASTVVNQQNAGLGTMETDQILDLFNLGETTDALEKSGNDGNEEDMVDINGEMKEKGKKGLLDDVGELWDEKQYDEEYNLDSFLATMKG
ncbi:MAG: TATA-binding protein-associated factor mot1 [Pycnora praestabilis]|nr:MAG: TATA-binding protein-associated factor mot1 [Pycnora praestabilis]